MLRLVSCLAALAACTDLSAATSGVCGNGAIDPGEDCDGNAAMGQACGAAGDANACHFVCTAGAACPSGFACGVDQRCRAPSGSFALGAGPFPFVASTFRGADVDGDGIADLIGLEGTHAEIRFGNAAANFGSVTDQIIPASTGVPAVADLDGDGREDLLLATPLGLVTMLGSASGFEQHPYSAIPLDSTAGGDIRVHQVHPLPGLAGDLVLVYDELVIPGGTLHEQLAYPGSDFATCFDGTVVTGANAGSCDQNATIAKLLGNDIAIGRTGYVWTCTSPLGTGCDSFSATDSTDEVAVALTSSLTVTLLSATEQVTAVTLVPEPHTAALAHVQDINLPVNHAVALDGRMMFADFDGDHCDDLAIPVVATPTTTTLAIAYNTGCTGKLADAVTVKSFTSLTGHSVGIPRLYADLNGDGIADVVTDQQIFFANCTPCGTAWKGSAVAVVPRPWTTVIALDLNEDGHVDLAGFVDGEADVDVLLNGGDGTFARFTVLTDLPVRSIRSGDFDGDLYEDIAIVTGDASSSAEDDALAIAYGAPAGGPSDPIPMGNFGVVRSFEPALIETTPGDPEGIADLLLVSERASHRNAAVMVGSTSRQVLAPFEIDEPGVQTIESPAILLAGNFDTGAGTDVAQVSANADLYVLSGVGGGDVVLGASYSPPTGNALASVVKNHVATTFTHGVLAPGAVESVIGFGSPTIALTLGAPCPDTVGVVATPTADGTSWTPSLLPAVPIPGPPLVAPNCLREHGTTTHDLDGDGADDVLLQLCDGNACNLAGSTAIAFGNAGTLDVAGATMIPTNGLVCGRFTPVTIATSGLEPLMAPCFEPPSADTDGPGPAFLVTFALTPGTRQLAEVSRFPIAETDLRLTVGDFNGDGLQDIALTAGAENQAVVRFYLQCAAGDPSCAAIEQVKP